MGQCAYDKREENDGWMRKQRVEKEEKNEGNNMKMEEGWVNKERIGGEECKGWKRTLGIKINCRRK